MIQNFENKNKLRVAVIGLGAVTHNIHLPAFAKLKGKITIVGGCDTNRNARELAKNKFGKGEIFEDALTMIEATAPDIVSICTPPDLHVEQTLLALKHNCHIFCEKPLANDLKGAKEIVLAAEKANRQVVVNSQFPFMNIHTGAKKLINSPEFGKLLFMQAWQTFHPTEKTEAGWRSKLQKRVCFEFGIHVFELARYFFEAEPVKISAQMPKTQANIDSDSLNLITIEFADSRAASIILNRLSKGPERYLDLWLDGEYASINTSIGGKLGIQAGIHTRNKRPFFDFNFVKGGNAVMYVGNKSKIIAKDDINPFAAATAHHFGNFIQAIENKTTPTGTAKDNLKTLALVFAAYHSAESLSTINMNDYLKDF